MTVDYGYGTEDKSKLANWFLEKWNKYEVNNDLEEENNNLEEDNNDLEEDNYDLEEDNYDLEEDNYDLEEESNPDFYHDEL